MPNQLTGCTERNHQMVTLVKANTWREAASLCRKEAERYHKKFPGEYEFEMDVCYSLASLMEGRAEGVNEHPGASA